MAQLRHDYDQFQALNCEVIVNVPNGPIMIQRHRQEHNPPYLILTDKGARVAAHYFQVKKFFLVGTPTVFLVDRSGTICYAHYARSPLDEPDNAEPLAVLAGMT